MSDSVKRKKWGKTESPRNLLVAPKRHERVTVAKQTELPAGYEDHIMMLEQRNRLAAAAKMTDKRKLEKERKEKGFALYVNGANAKPFTKNSASPSPRVPSSVKFRLANEIDDLNSKLSSGIPSNSRTRSAPERAEKRERKNWNAASVNIQTARGEKMHVHAPRDLTGEYSEDFESDSLMESHADIVDGGDDSEEDTQTSDRVLLSFNDVSKLRRSLQMSRGIQESLSLANHDSESSDVEEELMTLEKNGDPLPANGTIVLEFETPRLSPRKVSSLPVKMMSSKPPTQSVKSHDLELKMSASKKSGPVPLSAVKKKNSNSKNSAIDVSTEEKSSLLAAMEKENSAASTYLQSVNKSTELSPRRSLNVKSESALHLVEERVLQMEPEQQRDLIESLYKLEQSIRPSSTQVATRTSKSSLEKSKSKDRELHKVQLELLSNWGHERLIGLTEVAILDECNQRIDVNPAFIRLDGARHYQGQEEVLFNNKYKTVKERNMFCCEQASQRPITLTFRLEIPLGSRINKLKIWNYNKSLNDINIGVRRMRIRIDEDVIYDGEIDKGCGNQVFDYGFTIVVGSDAIEDDSDSSEELRALTQRCEPSLKKPRQSTEMWVPLKTPAPRSPERSETRTLNHATVDESILPQVEKDSAQKPAKDNKDKKEPFPKRRNPLKNSTDKPTPDAKKSHPKQSNSQKIAVKESEQRDVNTRSKLPWMDKLADVRAENSKSPQLEQWINESKHVDVRTSLDEMLEGLDKWENKKNGKSELKTIFDDGDTHTEPPKQTSRRRENVVRNRNNAKNKNSSPISMEVADECEEKTYRMSAQRDALGPELIKTDINSVARTRRRKWQSGTNDLEASWSSLDIFQKSHRGRLSTDRDALDGYLKEDEIPETESNLETITEEGAEEFIIPELPRGQELVINIKSTWGDKYYVGMNGIELFCETGEPITFDKITANPLDINILPEYKNDPRVVSNLIDGVNKTRDDVHMWMAPFTAGSNHFVRLSFSQTSTIALMRIWNYNKSRIHSYRGAREIEVSLDGKYIFKGEVARACGGTQGGTEAFGDTILFTMKDEILDAVSRHDGQYEGGAFSSSDEWDEDVPFSARPPTAETGESDRPLTTVVGKSLKNLTLYDNPIETELCKQAVPIAIDGTTLVYRAQRAVLNFKQTWGDPHYLGLTGIELVAKSGDPIPLDINMLHAEPRDLHVLPGYQNDDRTLDKVIDGENITTSDEHMWLVPYTEGGEHILEITLSQPTEIVGIRFWNYNKSPEDTYRGAKTVHISLDESRLSPPEGFLIRKGPGNCFYDFAQELLFSETLRNIQKDAEMEVKRLATVDDEMDLEDDSDYVISGNMPKGFVYQLHLVSTHGDLYYIGLNSIAFYDAEGRQIPLDENSIAAYPESVNVLEGISGDIRTPDKLILEPDNENMWLAPILPGITNRLFIIFDYPQTISMVKIWNYSKSLNRGVKEFALLLDDFLIYNGTLDAARYSSGILPGTGVQEFHTILFTNNKSIRDRFKHTLIKKTTEWDDITLTNDCQVVQKPTKKLQQTADQTLRPKTGMIKPGGYRRNR